MLYSERHGSNPRGEPREAIYYLHKNTKPELLRIALWLSQNRETWNKREVVPGGNEAADDDATPK